MKSYNKYSAAAWLLNEAMDPSDPQNEEDLDLEETETEEEDSEEEDEDEDFDLDDDSEEDSEEEDVDLDDIEISDEDEEDGEIDADLEARVKALEDKLDTMDIAKGDDDEVFDLDISNPVCPCCGSRLNIVNDAETDGDIDLDGDNDDSESLVDISSLQGPSEEDDKGEGEEIQVADDDFMVPNDYSSEVGGDWSKLEDLFKTGVEDNQSEDEEDEEDIEI